MKHGVKRTTAVILAALILASAGSATVAMVGTSIVAQAAESTVALVDGKEYGTLQDAFDACSDGVETTVTLQDNIENVTTEQIATVSENKNIILDMNGKKITVASDFKGRPIVNNGTLTITGNGIIDSSDSEFGGYGAVNNFGMLTIENGTFKGNVIADGSAVYVRPGSEAVINGGTFEGSAAVYNAGKLTVNDGTFRTTSCTQTVDSNGGKGHWFYCVVSSGELYFNNGSVTGVQGGLAINNGYAEVKDGTFKTVACEHSPTGKYSFYALYIAGEVGEVEAHISGGTYTSASRVAILCGNDNTGGDGGINAKATAYITGGTFTGGGDNSIAIQAGTNTGDPSISGGTFSSDVSAYVTGGSKQTKNEDGTFTISINKETAVAEINGAGFATLQEAIDAAQNGDTIQLLGDITADGSDVSDNLASITIDKSLTIEGNGHMIKTTGFDGSYKKHVIDIKSDGVTISDLKVDGSNDGAEVSAGHLINVYGTNPGDVILNNVELRNTSGGALVIGSGNVTATNLITEDVTWYSVNVDTKADEGDAFFTLNSGNLAAGTNDGTSIFIENGGEAAATATIIGGTAAGNVITTDKTPGTNVIDVQGGTVGGVIGILEIDETTGNISDPVNTVDVDETHRVNIAAGVKLTDAQARELAEKYLENNTTFGSDGTVITKAPVTPSIYTVAFDSNGGTEVATESVTAGSKVTEPTAPIKEGYIFAGWYTDADLTSVYDFEQTVTGNITLYAKWVESIPSVTVGRVTGLKAIHKTTSTLKLTFNQVAGADGYEIYDAETDTKLANCTTQNGIAQPRKTITGLKTGETRKYKVRAYVLIDGEKVYGEFSDVYTKATAYLEQVTGLKPIKKTKNSIKVQFNKVEGAAKYKVYDATTGKALCSVTTQGGIDVLKKTVTGLKPGTEYKLKVRAFTTINGKSEYGAFSKTITKATLK